MTDDQLELAASFADRVCMELADSDSEWVENQIQAVAANPRYAQWNATSVGNLAHIALKRPDLKDICLKILSGHKAWLEKKRGAS